MILQINGDIQAITGKKLIGGGDIYELDMKVGDSMQVILVIAISLLVVEIIRL